MSHEIFIKKVENFIVRHSLLRRDAKIIVAVSGGADSVALVSALVDLGYDCTAAHCNFHLRGEESGRDMRHVERLAERLGIDLYVKDFDVAARRKLTGESLEMACRELRYAWFAELLDRDCAQAVAVGHHAEDQTETFFLNLLRGAGVAGLGGMKPRQGDVVRPMLETTRAEIEEYLRSCSLGWVTDSTNTSDDFARNRLRNRLLPLLEELFPGASEAIRHSMEHLRENAALYLRGASDAIAPYRSEDSQVNLAALASDPLAGLILYEHLRGEGFNRSQTDDMLRAATRGTGATFHAAGTRHSRAVDHGILRAPCAETESSPEAIDISPAHDIAEPVRIAVSRHPAAAFSPERDPRVMYLDVRALEGSPRWQLRHRLHADRMRPFGMKGSRLVSDIFAGARLSEAEKQAAWLLTRDGEILWAVGLRASALFSVGPGTKEYLRLEYIP